MERFEGVNTQVLGISVDSTDCLRAWAESLDGITYPLLSDFYPHGRVAQMYGVLRPEGYSERALFIVDRRGVIRYVDVHPIDDQPDNEVLFKELARIEGVAMPAWKEVTAAPAAEYERPDVDVVMYCTSWCPACRRARLFLKENNVSFTEIDIGRDRVAAQRVRNWNGGHESTPTFDVRGTIVPDFNRARLMDLLGIQE